MKSGNKIEVNAVGASDVSNMDKKVLVRSHRNNT